MSLENMSTMIGPNILRSKDDMETVKETPTICKCASLFIKHYSKIFRLCSPYDPKLKGYLKVEENKKTDKFSGYMGRQTKSENIENKKYDIGQTRLTGMNLFL